MTAHCRADAINRALVDLISEAGDPEQRLQQALDQLSFVPFLHQANAAAAWMLCPSRHPPLGSGRFNPDRDYTVGVSREWNACIAHLRHDPLVETLLELTRAGRLFKSLPDYWQHKRGPVARHVSDDAKASSELAMDLAIQLALAGVVDGERLYGSADAEKPRYVALQVEPIYRDIIYKWSRSATPSSHEPLPSGESEQPTTTRERIESSREALRAEGESAVIEKLTAHVKDWDSADDTAVRLVLACPFEWRLPAELERFLEHARRHLDPDSLEYALIRERLRAPRRV